MATSKKEFRSVNLQGNEIQDVVIENLSSDPSGSSSGRLYYNTTDNKLKFHNGTSFAEVGSGGSGGSGVSVSSASFNTSNGVLTLTMSDSSTVSVDLDGRYLSSLEDDTTPRLSGGLDANNKTIEAVDLINFNTAPNNNLSVTADVNYNTSFDTLELKNDIGEILIGQTNEIYVTNGTGGAFPAYQAVYKTSVSSGKIAINSMIADGTIDAADYLGITTELIAKAGDGKVITFGRLDGIDTSSFSVNDTLYLSASSYGGLTATKPTGSNVAIATATVLTSATSGSIWVNANNIDLNASGGSSVTVDSTLSTTSTNPVENQAVTTEINTKQDLLTAGSGISISGNTISADNSLVVPASVVGYAVFRRGTFSTAVSSRSATSSFATCFAMATSGTSDRYVVKRNDTQFKFHFHHQHYLISGFGTDVWRSRLSYRVNGGSWSNFNDNVQSSYGADGGGTRSGTLFPLSHNRTNSLSVGDIIECKVDLRSDSSDDTVTFATNNDRSYFEITEYMPNSSSQYVQAINTNANLTVSQLNSTTINLNGASLATTLSGKQDNLTFGISDNNAVKINSSDVTDGEYAKFTASGLESKSNSEILSDLGIETGATADQSASEIKTAYESNADTNAYTDTEKAKLSGIEANAEVNVNSDWNATTGDAEILNKPTDLTDLTSHNSTELSDITSAGSGSIITTAERNKLSGIESGATGDQSAAEIKTAYESNSNTNAYTDAEQAKLGYISVSQAVDLDTMESNISANNAKVSNATHTGDVTGSTELTITNEAVTNAKMAQIATGKVKGRTSTGTGEIEDLNIETTLKTALNLSKSDVGLANVINTDTTNASNISSGTLSTSRLPTNINATNIADGTISNDEFQRLNGVTSNIQPQLNNKLESLEDDTNPYLGGNLNCDGNEIINPAMIDWDTNTPSPITALGEMSYDLGYDALRLYNDTGKIHYIGQDQDILLGASETVTIGQGVSLKATSVMGFPQFEKFIANGTKEAKDFVGLAITTTSNNNFGKILKYGYLNGVNTSSYSVGDKLYPSASTAGGLTNTQPTGSNVAICVATVATSATNGKILVHSNNIDLNASGSSVTVDSTLSTTSTNPVENQAVTNEINTKQDTISGTTDLTVNELTTNGNLKVKEDQDMSIILGRCRLDARFNDTWNFSHYDLTSNSEYQFSGNTSTVFLNGPTYVRLQSGGNTIASVISDGIEFESGNNYYMRNNANFVNRKNASNLTPSSTATVYYPAFPNSHVINSDLFSYTAPSGSQNTGFQLKKAGQYKVTYTVNWNNSSYTNRVNYWCEVVKHSSAVTTSITSCAGSHSFAYSRDDSFVKYATNSNSTIIDATAANEYIKIRCRVAKNDDSFNDNFSGIKQQSHGSIIIEYLGSF